MPCSLAEHALTSALLPTPPLSPKPAAPRDIDIPLMHTLHTELSSVLSVTADEKHIFSGSQGYDIFVSHNFLRHATRRLIFYEVWDRCTFTAKTTLRGHTGSVLALELAREKEWLISSSGESSLLCETCPSFKRWRLRHLRNFRRQYSQSRRNLYRRDRAI